MKRSQREQRIRAEKHPVAWQVRELIREHGLIETTPTRWLELLNQSANENTKISDDWPKNAEQLGRVFSELTSGLALLGILVEYRRHGLCGRLWRVEAESVRRHNEEFFRALKEAEAQSRRAEKANLRVYRALARSYRKQRERKTG